MNLSLIYNVSVSPSKPYFFYGYNNHLYVGTKNDMVLVLSNKVIIRSFTAFKVLSFEALKFRSFKVNLDSSRSKHCKYLFAVSDDH